MSTGKYDHLKLDNQLCFPLYACSREVVKRYTPYLNALDAQGAAALEAEVLRGAAELYRPRPNGEVLFPFRRLFWVAVREA